MTMVRIAFAGLLLAAGAAIGPVESASAQVLFYSVPAADVAGQPGTIIRQEPITGAPLGASACRVLYRSTGCPRHHVGDLLLRRRPDRLCPCVFASTSSAPAFSYDPYGMRY